MLNLCSFSRFLHDNHGSSFLPFGGLGWGGCMMYWKNGEPSNGGGTKTEGEDCVEHFRLDGWNFAPCLKIIFWICEKNLDVLALPDLHV
uniref:C-type lectin domain-containing protein n=1 Tax=Gadus morhua TaxID=8049 RepID=A0A8C5AD47_GADMO